MIQVGQSLKEVCSSTSNKYNSTSYFQVPSISKKKTLGILFAVYDDRSIHNACISL